MRGSLGGCGVAGATVGTDGRGARFRDRMGEPPYCAGLRAVAGDCGKALRRRGVWSIASPLRERRSFHIRRIPSASSLLQCILKESDPPTRWLRVKLILSVQTIKSLFGLGYISGQLLNFTRRQATRCGNSLSGIKASIDDVALSPPPPTSLHRPADVS